MSELSILEQAIATWGEPVQVFAEEAKFVCPECSKKAFYFNLVKGLANCFACGYGKGITNFRVKESSLAATVKIDPKLHSKVAQKIIEITSLEEHHRSYLKKRGIINPDKFLIRTAPFQAHKLLRSYFSEEELLASGYCNNRNGFLPSICLAPKRILIPYWEGDVFYTLKSRVDPFNNYDHDVPRYINAKGSNLDSRIFQTGNMDSRDLIITEGEFKALAAISVGYSTIAIPGIAYAKNDLLRKIRYFTNGAERVFIIFDTDEDYQNKKPLMGSVNFLRKNISNSCICFLPSPNNKKVDLDSYLAANSLKDFDALLEDAWQKR